MIRICYLQRTPLTIVCRRLNTRVCSDWPGERKFSRSFIDSLEERWHEKILTGNSVSTVCFLQIEISSDSKGCQYVLSMFPYPSGNLHMGHVRVYTISDCLARFHCLKGQKVIHPIGWDSFGLPAENAAMERKIDPKTWTEQNIATMRNQLTALGCSFDWSRELATSDPSYYKWTQLIFLKLHEAGLAYQKKSSVNWDPVDCTVLANEQINAEGRSWRSGAKVEKKLLRQWFIRTTKFAEALSKNLSSLSQWDDIAEIQRHWIGPIDTTKFHLKLTNAMSRVPDDFIDLCLPVPSDLLKLKFILLKSSHFLNQISEFTSNAKRISCGSVLDCSAVHPISGVKLPIVVSDTLTAFSNLEVLPGFVENLTVEALRELDLPPSQDSSSATIQADEFVLREAEKNNFGGWKTSSRLDDWIVSRQRYWGTPIPIIHCTQCKAQPVPVAELPVRLPESHRVDFRSQFGSPLAAASDWLNVKCPKCGLPAKRETDTLDTFFDSSWYYLRYVDPHNEERPFDSHLANQTMPVDIYIGGKEHAALHLYYARFMCHFLHSIGWVGCAEPFARLLPQGMVMARTYQIVSTGEYILPERVQKIAPNCLSDSVTGHAVSESWEKMSKSKHNGVEPMEILKLFGCDVTRLMITAEVAPKSHRNWSLDSQRGMQHMLNRVLWLVCDYIERNSKQDAPPLQSVSGGNDEVRLSAIEGELKSAYNFYVRLVAYHINSTFLLSVAISRLQQLVNVLRKIANPLVSQKSIQYERCLLSLPIMLYPFAPHIASELWSGIQSANVKQPQSWKLAEHVWHQCWPVLDADAHFDLEFYVNGTYCAHESLDRRQLAAMSANEALKRSLQQSSVCKALSGKAVLQFSLEHLPDYGSRLNILREKSKERQQTAAVKTARQTSSG